MKESAQMLRNAGIEPVPTFTGHAVLDVDVSVHDNSGTKKEGVERTYMGIDGYAPIYAYLGADTLCFAKEFTAKKLLVRLASGNDALDNIKLFIKEDADYIIKRNLRNESKEEWLDTARRQGNVLCPREGKVVYTGNVWSDRGIETPIRIVFQVTERTILANGRLLISPEIDVQTWWTSLENPGEEIIRFYHERTVCEQFHSEIKSDIGLECFPLWAKTVMNRLIFMVGILFPTRGSPF